MATSIKEKADMLAELIRNTDRPLSHSKLEPAELRANLERIAAGAFTPEEAHRLLGFAQGVCLSFSWVDWKDMEAINNGTFRRKAQPRPATPDSTGVKLGSTHGATESRTRQTDLSGPGDEG